MKILLCKPDYFSIDYEINPWMKTSDAVNPDRAMEQWRGLKHTYESLGYDIQEITPIEGLPDMVFTANGALVIDGKVALPTFRYAERQPETEYFNQWFQQHGYDQLLIPQHAFEGEGDALVCNGYILGGYGFRSSRESHAELEAFFDHEVLSLELVDDRFYHIDTCLTILDSQTIAFFPPAFSEASQKLIREKIPNTIEADEASAVAFGLNAMSDGRNVVMSDQATGLIERVKAAGYIVHPIAIDEFRKSGGGIKCLTLALRD